MKIVNHLCLSLLLVAGMPARGLPDTFRTDINPALIYYQAFLLEPPMPQTNRDYLFTNNWACPLPDHVLALISPYTNSDMRLWQQAAAQQVPCDWGIDLSPGPETLLPQLAYCKRAAQVSRLLAMWKLQQGDEPGARDILLAALATGRNSSRDGTLIAVLVQFAIENIVISTVAENFNHFSPETLRQLADGFAAAPERHTVADSMATERFSAGYWLDAQIQAVQKANPSDESAVMNEVQRRVEQIQYNGETNFWQELTDSAGGTVGGLVKLTRESEAFYRQLPTLLTLPHGEFEDRIKQFGEEVQKSGNYLSIDALPAWPNSRRKEFTVQAELAMLQAAIAYKLRGEAGLKSVNDPFGDGPFTCERFVFQGENRGFQLVSKYAPLKGPVKVIFVEKDGPPFKVLGPAVGEPATP